MAENKSSLDNVLRDVLAIGNKEANLAYPPTIYSSHFNITTSFIIDHSVANYPEAIDLLRPFVRTKKIKVKDGLIELPDDYRNLLGAPSIAAKKDKSGECGDPVVIDTESEFKLAVMKSSCQTRPIEMLDEETWDYRTTSEYDFPTYWNPIGVFQGANSFKVCPFDLGTVEMRYVKRENIYLYNYEIQPDDTYIFKADGSVESEWTNAAHSLLVRGVLSLYSAYQRDPSISDYSKILNQAGLF